MISISSAVFGASIATVFAHRFKVASEYEEGKLLTSRKLLELKNFIKVRRSLAGSHILASNSPGSFMYWDQISENDSLLLFVQDEALLLVRRYFSCELESLELILSIERIIIYEILDPIDRPDMRSMRDILKEMDNMTYRILRPSSLKQFLINFTGLDKVIRPKFSSVSIYREKSDRLQTRIIQNAIR